MGREPDYGEQQHELRDRLEGYRRLQLDPCPQLPRLLERHVAEHVPYRREQQERRHKGDTHVEPEKQRHDYHPEEHRRRRDDYCEHSRLHHAPVLLRLLCHEHGHRGAACEPAEHACYAYPYLVAEHLHRHIACEADQHYHHHALPYQRQVDRPHRPDRL